MDGVSNTRIINGILDDRVMNKRCRGLSYWQLLSSAIDSFNNTETKVYVQKHIINNVVGCEYFIAHISPC